MTTTRDVNYSEVVEFNRSSVSSDEDDTDSCYSEQNNLSLSVPTTALEPVVSADASFIIENSHGVTVGNAVHYNGPVNVHQVVHVSNKNNVPTHQEILQNGILSHSLESCGDSAIETVEDKRQLIETTSNASTEYRVIRGIPPHIFWILLALLILTLLGLIITVSLEIGGPPARHNQPVQFVVTTPVPVPTQAPATEKELTLPSGKKIISRSEWGSKGTRGFAPLAHPTQYVLISHSATRPCSSIFECSILVRSFQRHHLSLNTIILDIGYNFLVSSNGLVFEGRGWDVKSFHKYDYRTLGICFIGNFMKDEPTAEQINAAQELLQFGVQLGKLAADYRVISHNQTMSTGSPGEHLYAVIETWPHWNGGVLE